MKQQEMVDELAEIFEVEAAALTPETTLDSLRWDSMAMLSVIALLKNQFGKKVSGAELREMKTIQDILVLLT